jgi:hypothetical protein
LTEFVKTLLSPLLENHCRRESNGQETGREQGSSAVSDSRFTSVQKEEKDSRLGQDSRRATGVVSLSN